MDDSIELKYEQSIVACLDIIGFTDHVKYNARDKNQLLKVLSDFVKLNGDGFAKHENDGSGQIRPTITCFSDSVAISVPLNDATSQKLFDIYLQAVLNAIAQFALIALPEGLFFRGSISYGQLHHSSGVLIGDAWIEAVEYEKIAGYPRVILSTSFSKLFNEFISKQELGLTERAYCFKPDHGYDNKVFFDYLDFFLTYPDDGAYQKRVHQLYQELLLAGEFITQDQDIGNIKPEEKKPSVSIEDKLEYMKKYVENFRGLLEPEIAVESST